MTCIRKKIVLFDQPQIIMSTQNEIKNMLKARKMHIRLSQRFCKNW